MACWRVVLLQPRPSLSAAPLQTLVQQPLHAWIAMVTTDPNQGGNVGDRDPIGHAQKHGSWGATGRFWKASDHCSVVLQIPLSTRGARVHGRDRSLASFTHRHLR